jgi:hypothetical protein
VALALAGDEMPPRISKFASLGISCADEDGYVPGYHLPTDVPAEVDPAAIDRARGFAVELVRQLDRDLGRRRGDHH